jgi:hypothetical protein
VKKGGLPRELARLDKLLLRGLSKTASLWPQIRSAYEWIHKAAHLLSNEEGLSIFELRRAYRGLLAQMSPYRQVEGTLSSAVAQFLKVTKSYWRGLFQCYKVAELPRTNNDLEHYFGSTRYHERRASGRKAASPALVVRGSVRIIAAVATRARTFEAADIRPGDPEKWQTLRSSLERRRTTRQRQLRFRRDPVTYLARLEEQLLKQALPS